MMHIHGFPSAVSGVLYAEDFDEPAARQEAPRSAGPKPVVEPEFIPPSFSLVELRAATDQAHEEGRLAERSTMADALTAQRNAALTNLAEQLCVTQQQSRQIVEEALDGIAQTVLSLLTVALPALCASRAEDELRALLRRLLPPIRQLPDLHIRIHPSVREAVENETIMILDGSGTQVIWTESAKLAPGDIAIAWQNGGALRDTAATCTGIRNAILTLFDNEHETPVPENHHVQ